MTPGSFLPVARGYLVAGLLVTLALAFGFLLGPEIEVQLGPLLFIAAGMLTAWFAGLGPGLVAVLLSTLLVEYYWTEPRASWTIDPSQIPWFVSFTLITLLAMVLSLQRRRYETELARRVSERTEQLNLSEERWRRLFETASVGIAISEPEGRFLQVNQALQTMLGYSEAEFRSLTLAKLLAESDTLDNAKELALRHKEGQTIWVTLSLSPIPASESSPPLTSLMMIDVTEQRRALDDWRRAQIELGRVTRLTTMGVLSASIAHEVNQPLSAIVTNGQAARRWMKTEPPNLLEADYALERMIRNAVRAADVIRSIRQLLAPAGGERQLLSLREMIRHTLTLVDNEMAGQHVALSLDLAAERDQLHGDPVQLQQLLLNLVMNSLDSLRTVSQRKRQIRIATTIENGQLQAVVEDNGRGLDESADIDRLFEPFYTTKPGGMGVGLAICHHVVESHGGRIWAERRQPHGASFFFTLPLAEAEVSVDAGGKS
jgi:C4-dicarboxylate-specific signal transduction histidine kinase